MRFLKLWRGLQKDKYRVADSCRASDYYPFGLAMKGRTSQQEGYRYGFNGKEDDTDFGNSQLIQDYGFRLYNPSIAKFLSVDPLAPDYPWYTPYQFAGNKPIAFVDLDGLEEFSAQLLDRYNMANGMTRMNGKRWIDNYEQVREADNDARWKAAVASTYLTVTFGAAPMLATQGIAINGGSQLLTQFARAGFEEGRLNEEVLKKALSRIDLVDLAIAAVPFGKFATFAKPENMRSVQLILGHSGNIIGATIDYKGGTLTHIFGQGENAKQRDQVFKDWVIGAFGPTLGAFGFKLSSKLVGGVAPMGKTLWKDENFFDSMNEHIFTPSMQAVKKILETSSEILEQTSNWHPEEKYNPAAIERNIKKEQQRSEQSSGNESKK